MKMTGRFASAALATGSAQTTVILDVFGDHAAEQDFSTRRNKSWHC